MTERIAFLLKQLKDKEYKKYRKDCDMKIKKPETSEENIEMFKAVIAAETPVLYEGDSFGFNRKNRIMLPACGGNITPDYEKVITEGFDELLRQIRESIEKTDDEEKKKYGRYMEESLTICLEMCERYRAFAKEQNNTRLYDALSRIPHKGAQSFYEACVFVKLCNYFLRYYAIEHIGIGRFDKYMYPFYLHDKENGVSDEEILETVEEFFISLNYDTDLYFGILTGDNGQSLMLGGRDNNGGEEYNELFYICLKASLELNIIDPKINIRVSKNTPDKVYEYATELTKKGLGFPQYCNDDVVIPGLIKLGYEPEDAVDYTVAACWEYIIPAIGADIPNIEVMDFPYITSETVRKHLKESESFDELIDKVCKAICIESERLIDKVKGYTYLPKPLLSAFSGGCTESLTDLWHGGGKYNNYGFHGAGIANATDALAAIKKCVYDDKTITKEQLLEALNSNFEGFEEIRKLLKAAPKMGNNDDFADDIAGILMDAFTGSMNGKDNGRGGVCRTGTGSAMEYIFKGRNCPATADGRRAGEPYSSSFSPSMDVRPSGLLSVIQSFTKYDMTKIINGGPLTVEIHDTVFRNSEGISKVAKLVKSFILLGGHQLQLNTLNRERLIDAQKHPENHPDLIVRVWGWSGYFNELDPEFQNHIIRRCEYGV